MNRLKTLIWTLIVSCIALTSCNDDWSDSDNLNYGVSRATISSVEEGDFRLKTDLGNELLVVSDIGEYEPKIGQRVILNFVIEEQIDSLYKIDLLNLREILTKEVEQVVTVEEDMEFGNDPIELLDIWCAGGYLNVNFRFVGSGMISHRVSVVENTLVNNPSDGKIYLEFRHNAYDDEYIRGFKGTASYNLAPYKTTDGSTVTFEIQFVDDDATITIKTIEYDFLTNQTVSEQEAEEEEAYH